jgi:sugar phosphate isomerase/epimerase
MIRLSCSTLCFDGFEDNDFALSLEMMPKAGYRYVELNCWHPSNLTPAKTRELRRRCDEAGLTPATVYGSSFGGDLTKDVTHKIRMIEAARELGCRRISATGPKKGDPGAHAHIARALREIVPAAQEMDVLICLENHAGNTLEGADDYARVFDAVSSDHLGICIDTGHFDAAGVDMIDLIRRMGDRVNHIHLKENRAFGKVDFVRFGQGNTDHHGVIKAMLERGYEGYINIELSPTSEGVTPGKPDIEDMIEPLRIYGEYATA